MTKNFVFRARVDDQEKEKINRLVSAIGCNQSQLLRRLLEQARLADSPVSGETLRLVVGSEGKQDDK